MSRGHSLICFDCNQRRNKFGMQVTHMKKVVGHVCIKCSKKREVSGRPAGTGWRHAFQAFAQSVLRARQEAIDKLRRRPALGRAV